MQTHYDVIIIGAGPAGSSCARTLVENGVKTLILEQKKLPRYKTCGGLLSKKAVKLINKNFGQIPDEVYSKTPVVKGRITKRIQTFIENENLIFESVRRRELDHWLIKKSDAYVKDEFQFYSFVLDKKGYKIFSKQNHKKIEITCHYLIGADGANSTVRKIIDPTFDRNMLICNIQKVYSGTSQIDDSYYNFIINKKYSDIVSWFCSKDDQIYIGTSFFPVNKKANYYEQLLYSIKERFDLKINKLLRIESCTSYIKNKMERYFFGINNILLVGEASGLLYDFSVGIPSALISGDLAAQSIISARKNNESAAEIYIRKIQFEKKYSQESLKI